MDNPPLEKVLQLPREEKAPEDGHQGPSPQCLLHEHRFVWSLKAHARWFASAPKKTSGFDLVRVSDLAVFPFAGILPLFSVLREN